MVAARTLLALSLFLAWGGCSDARLQALVGQPAVVDDKLDLSAQFCTSPPDQIAFPVKLLIVIDQSASLQCTDPGNARISALAQAGAALDPLPNVSFGVVGFASWSKLVDFTPNWSTAAAALAPSTGSGGPATDYQGSLATVLTVLEREMLRAGPAENARSRYVVLFLSDGVPEPRCRAGCNDGDTLPDSLYGVCNTTQSLAEGDYVDMNTPCPEYNQPAQITRKVEDIRALADFYGVGELSFNTVLLFADEDAVAQVCGDATQFGYIKSEASPLLQAMADAGGGTFRDINTSGQIDFLDFDYASLEAPYAMNELFAINMSAMPTEQGPVPDSDQDGLPDSLEFAEGLDRLKADTDGDGYGDLFERTYLTHGFDPLDPNIPAWGCADRYDRDGDGLLACEEAFLGTSVFQADTDGDLLPDGIELRFGMDPTVDDTRIDHDLDGRVSGVEVRTGTHPMIYEENALLHQVRTTVTAADDWDGRTCYDLGFQDLTLVPALAPDEQKGLNEIHIFSAEAPSGVSGSSARFHKACVKARYLGESFKDPADGVLEDLSHYFFVELPEFDASTHCLPVGGDPTLRPEWAWGQP